MVFQPGDISGRPGFSTAYAGLPQIVPLCCATSLFVSSSDPRDLLVICFLSLTWELRLTQQVARVRGAQYAASPTYHPQNVQTGR